MTERRPWFHITIPPLPTLRTRTALSCMVMAAFILSMGTLAFFPIPETNKELFSTAMGALNLLIGAIAGYYWPRDDRSNEEAGQ